MIDIQVDADNRSIEFHVSGKITQEDYEKVYAATEELIAKHDKIRMLKHVGDFEGLTETKMLENMKRGFSYFHNIERAALVTDKDWAAWLTNALDPFFPMKMKAFDEDELDAARVWLLSGD
jgi:hypothetical protein